VGNPRLPISEPPSSVLVIKPSSLGDVVHTLPAVASIKRHWPAARLRWLINPECAPLLEDNAHVDDVVIFPRDQFRGFVGWTKIPRWFASLRKRARSDLVLDFQGLLRSALIARGMGPSTVIGLSDAREGAHLFYHAVADVSTKTHAVERYLAIPALFHAENTAPLEWPLPAGKKPPGFVPEQPFVLLHPFARGAGKSLAVTDVRALCEALAPSRVVLVGRANMDAHVADNVIDLVNSTSVAELIWLLRHASYIISVDSGPMHIAAALTSRLVAIHTWSDPRRVGPYQPQAWVWQDGVISRVADLDRPERSVPVPDVRALAAFVQAQMA
jgi:ADP-heptose:LPS heptosyltransferase